MRLFRRTASKPAARQMFHLFGPCAHLRKALGNGHAISAVLGGEGLRKAARRILFTSTYMFESPPMRARIE